MSTQNAASQGANFSNTWIGESTEMYIKYTENITFENVKTDRSSDSSIISFASLSGTTSINGYIDGRAKVYETDNLVFLPTGNNISSPVKLTNVTISNEPVMALYNEFSPEDTDSYDTDILMVSDNEHWAINSNNSANITVKWTEESGYGSISQALSLDLEDVTIVAWNGEKWIVLPSSVDIGSTLNEGSITTDGIVDFSSYNLFTLAFKNGCMQVVNATGEVIYDGLWDSSPDELTTVIINSALTVTPETSFVANNLILNSDITITDGAYIDVLKDVTGEGTIFLTSESSFVQRASSAAAPQIELTKETRPLRKWDYAYWGTPIQENFIDQISNAKSQSSQVIAFDVAYKYVSQDGDGGSWQNLDQIIPGKGFITRIKNQAPFIDDEYNEVIEFPIIGTANNGTIQVELGSATTGARSYNLLANPYPSAIDAGEFLRSNLNLGGAIYLWTANEYNSAGAVADYAVWNLAGSVTTLPEGTSQVPTGYISSGQGFMVKGLTSEGVAMFTNCMRVTGNNNNYFRTNEDEKDRYWLNLTNTEGIFSQILINYTEEATYDYDRLYDANRNSTSTSQLYSFIEDSKYAINSRPEFDANDEVPLGVSRTANDGNMYTITLQSPEGIFATSDVTIYLHDMYLDEYHNLNLSDYNFTAVGLQNNDRFEVVYQSSLLGENDLIKNRDITMNINNSQFNVNASVNVNSIIIYDITGRMVQEYDVKNNITYNAPFNHSQGIYIAKAVLTDGSTVTQKLINGI
ncbi:T9SS C-terminal target domain-containing protein [Flavobacterium arcticum]|uniref:T9SS C-terminal target domain-containing protein n=1 Tax=Flavobacterium arcticum TaxID=1784713 RepID=A0A345HB94_9FLAO|nr:T9SS type A sorting domain-containing protein [Flavobacterium arcticum]AXG73854.1 T9SS C-terminal target domain-containing protein [Flavobacterium arcticum]KAF2511807.1 T9SS type A sorting domain-containing protein [Flavobacterium arcticum]